MARTDFKTVDAYLATQPEASLKALASVRDALRKAVPLAEECVSYQIPAYKLSGTPLFYFAGWKTHYALYPVSEKLAAAFEKEIAPFLSSKATLRFDLSEPVPVKLISRLAKFRAGEIAERVKAKAGPSQKGKAKVKAPVKTRVRKPDKR